MTDETRQNADRDEAVKELSVTGNETDAERFAEELAENEAEAASAVDGPADDGPEQPKGKLDRLQKILAAAGVASRRAAEELITQGRVEVNGAVVTAQGTKADASRDHIRVDGKLLHGAERLRYFVLNKPKGFVTTVKDPEGRPTVMQFFAKMKERLYPVGRLDYLSEGLLVVTNDGELANRLTKASTGVEKTYLVKVSGQPSKEEVERLRRGVAIEREGPGSGKVQTAPAQLRQVRQGDNPWFEVVLIEGRNRELRKMFEEIGHHVEKIRRVGYGPLVLDMEPGNMRELDAEELAELRKAAEGRQGPHSARELRQRKAMDEASLPTVLPRPTRRAPVNAEKREGVSETGRGPERLRPKNFRFDKAKRNPGRGERKEQSRGGVTSTGWKEPRPDGRKQRSWSEKPMSHGESGSIEGGRKLRQRPEVEARDGGSRGDDRPRFGVRQDRPSADPRRGSAGSGSRRPEWSDRRDASAGAKRPGGLTRASGDETRPKGVFRSSFGARQDRKAGQQFFGSKPQPENRRGRSDFAKKPSGLTRAGGDETRPKGAYRSSFAARQDRKASQQFFGSKPQPENRRGRSGFAKKPGGFGKTGSGAKRAKSGSGGNGVQRVWKKRV